MATARHAKIERVIKEDGVELTLTAAEARTLATICYKTSGDPDKSPRAHTDSIGAALRNVGYYGSESPEYDAIDHGVGFGNYCSSKYYPVQ